MILDSQTNKVFFAEGLRRYRTFFNNLKEALQAEEIDYDFLPGTDRREYIWARDYMPIQLEKGLFLLYKYSPDYLVGYPHYIPDYKRICDDLGLNCISTDIVLDGGNVIKCGDKVIMTEKIFKENPGYKQSKLTDALENILSAEIVIIPWDRFEIFGHADGMVRYLGGNKVLINNYMNIDLGLRISLLEALSPHFEVQELDYKVEGKSPLSWVLLNFLQVKDCIFVPWVGKYEPHPAQAQLQNAFPDRKVRFVAGADQIAKKGGGLNCVSWNLLLHL